MQKFIFEIESLISFAQIRKIHVVRITQFRKDDVQLREQLGFSK